MAESLDHESDIHGAEVSVGGVVVGTLRISASRLSDGLAKYLAPGPVNFGGTVGQYTLVKVENGDSAGGAAEFKTEPECKPLPAWPLEFAAAMVGQELIASLPGSTGEAIAAAADDFLASQQLRRDGLVAFLKAACPHAIRALALPTVRKRLLDEWPNLTNVDRQIILRLFLPGRRGRPRHGTPVDRSAARFRDHLLRDLRYSRRAQTVLERRLRRARRAAAKAPSDTRHGKVEDAVIALKRQTALLGSKLTDAHFPRRVDAKEARPVIDQFLAGRDTAASVAARLVVLRYGASGVNVWHVNRIRRQK
jgi:hypothetical protein